VILDADGRPQFERLSRRSRLKRRISIEHGARTDPACFFAFDVLELEDEDLRPRPLFNRKALLKDTIAAAKDPLHGPR
jgi:ATP-dependent DNA ligase